MQRTINFIVIASNGRRVPVEDTPCHKWTPELFYKTTYDSPSAYTGYIVLYEREKRGIWNIATLLATCEAIDGKCQKVEVLLCGEGQEEETREVASNYLALDSAGILLYDQTGKLDDISCFPSHSIIVESDSPHIAITEDFRPHLSNKRKQDIKDWLRISCADMFFDSAARSITEGDFVFSNVKKTVEAMSFGHVEVVFTKEDADTYWKYDIKKQNDNGVFSTSCAMLAANDVSIMDEKIGRAMQCCTDTGAVMEIWKHACELSGTPVSIVEDAGMRNPDKKMIRKLGELFGIDSMVDAYFRGVPLDDILA